MTAAIVAALPVGSIAGWLTVIAITAAAWAVWRGGGGTALATLEAANRVLEGRVHELEKLRHDDQLTITELRAKTDVTLALTPIIEWSINHEIRAQERHTATIKGQEATLKGQDATLAVLQLVADRLGPDPNHHEA